MATKLKNLHLTKVDAVDEGANPGARITLFKRREGEGSIAGGMPAAEPEPGRSAAGGEGLLKRFCSFLVESGGFDPAELAKQAHSFQEAIDEQARQRVFDEAYILTDALRDSIYSILHDEELDGTGRQAALAKTLSEFSAAAGGCLASWAEWKSAGIVKKKADPDPEADVDEGSGSQDGGAAEKDIDGDGAADGSEEGEEEDMRIDKSKMTPEDLKAYEELEKKYAQADGGEGTADGGKGTGAAGGAAGGEGSPAVEKSAGHEEAGKAIQAELESLRKFRQEMELSQMEAFARKYEPLGKKPAELAKSLKAAKDAGGTAYDDMVAMLDEMLSMQEGLFTEIGKSGHKSVDMGGAETVAKIHEIAKGYVDKDPALSMDMALTKAWENNPELMRAYESEAGF